jgi:DNA segregation ATPase FtsK/SpoIIIE, S-DNA-T family
MKVRSDCKNISNYFSKTNDISKDLTYIMKNVTDSVFGLEISLSKNKTKTFVVTPPYVRLQDYTAEPYRDCPTEEFTCYEGYLSEPFIMPLYEALDGQFIEDLGTVKLSKNEAVYVQWLFRKKTGWRELGMDMFESYLEGNDKPVTSRVGRFIQGSAAKLLGKVIPVEENSYIEEVEKKLMCEAAYQFQLRVAIKSDRQKELKYEIGSLFSKYDSYNSIKLGRSLDTGVRGLYANCVLTATTADQIISTEELFSLVGGVIEDVVEGVVEQVEESVAITVTSPVELLPAHKAEFIEPDKSLISNIAKALKRVKLVDIAQLYEPTIATGARLTVVQARIPKDRIIDEVQNKTKAIRAALGVNSLLIEQGDEADTVKFSIPNKQPVKVGLREIMETKKFKDFAKENPLAFVAGVDELGEPLIFSIVQLVHLLVAGSTGSGKSVFLNSVVLALILQYPPELLRLVMIDPATVELTQYNGFPHVDKVVTDMGEAYQELYQLTEEMAKRYEILEAAGVKNISQYNKKMSEPMPYLVCVIDEYADLYTTHSEVEDCIARLGQLARKVGIHLIVATQRPSAQVISGDIKANLKSVFCFNLGNNTHYKTVFGEGLGNLKLLGCGDGVMRVEGTERTYQRFQGVMFSPDEMQEEEVYNNIRDYYTGIRVNTKVEEPVAEITPTFPPEKPTELSSFNEPEVAEEVVEEPSILPMLDAGTDDPLYKLKQLIATTRETKMKVLREEMKIKNTTLSNLMQQLVEEGWLEKSPNKSIGYILIAPESTLSEWKTN